MMKYTCYVVSLSDTGHEIHALFGLASHTASAIISLDVWFNPGQQSQRAQVALGFKMLDMANVLGKGK